MQVKDVMKQPYTIDKDVSIEQIAKVMVSKKIDYIIFVNKEEVKGIITKSDLIRNFGKSVNLSKAMSKDIISISQEESLDEALELMKENSVKRLLVMEDKELLGVLDLVDIANNSDSLEGDFFFE